MLTGLFVKHDRSTFEFGCYPTPGFDSIRVGTISGIPVREGVAPGEPTTLWRMYTCVVGGVRPVFVETT